mmetsp:Transcript_15302/g.25451  ORF Transcript_15302/g.25451 Transcript_15302/m.25451 type:complete len:83 (+) Transcript_15302:4385-4633(+)
MYCILRTIMAVEYLSSVDVFRDVDLCDFDIDELKRHIRAMSSASEVLNVECSLVQVLIYADIMILLHGARVVPVSFVGSYAE